MHNVFLNVTLHNYHATGSQGTVHGSMDHTSKFKLDINCWRPILVNQQDMCS